jgi:DNA-binding response OmpR family regulator
VNTPAQQVVAIETVLVVEDEAMIRASIAEYLRDCGYRVLEAATAKATAKEAMVVHRDRDAL